MTLKDMVKIKVKVIILLLLETIQFCYWTFSPKCILTEDIREVRYFSMTLYVTYTIDKCAHICETECICRFYI